MIIVSKTYEVVTEESAEHGDFAETGFVFEDDRMTLEEVLREIDKDGFCEWSSSDPTILDCLSTVDPEVNYSTGEQTYYSLHFENISEQDFNTIINYVKERF
jgi:hypothetical protein